LRDPSPQKRAAAAKKIEARGEALDELAYLLLNDPSPEVRIATTSSLEKSKDPAALAVLIGCLNDAVNAVVIECMDSLEFAGDESTVEHLAPFLQHADEGVRDTAADAIEFLE
jgi:HEAT repeat protein